VGKNGDVDEIVSTVGFVSSSFASLATASFIQSARAFPSSATAGPAVARRAAAPDAA